jgi:Protein of unknown function (DUF1488)
MEHPMVALERRDGIVGIQPCGVAFPMRAGRMDLTCFQTRAGFEKILGRKNLTVEQMQVVFHDHREDFERLANLLYECHAGDVLTITITPAGDATGIASRE